MDPSSRPWASPMEPTSTPKQLELGAHIRTLERLLVITQLTDGCLCHAVTRRHQPIDASTKQRTFTYGKNIGVTGFAVVVNFNTAALAHLQATESRAS